MSSEVDIKEVHDQMLVLLKRFHEICIENGIKYSLHGGTLLEAIREKGFIPWDDDAYISLTRSEYDELRIAMKNLDGKCDFYFCDHIHSRFQVPHFCMKQEGEPLVWVDLLIYDFISENLILQKNKNNDHFF